MAIRPSYYERKARAWPGVLWKPVLSVYEDADGWHWVDKAKGVVGVGGGPFSCENHAWKDICVNYGDSY